MCSITEALSEHRQRDPRPALHDPRYGVVDVNYTTDDGRPQEKIVFFLWSPDSCGVKDKMLYASYAPSIAIFHCDLALCSPDLSSLLFRFRG